MPEHELEKLLGGFAADTLTQQERETLFQAALHDQRLFNALADEQAFKELLTDPAVRRRLLQALDRHDARQSTSWWSRFTTPSGLTWAGGVAVGVFAVVLGLKIYQDSLRQASETAVLEVGRPAAPATVPPAAAPKADREIAAPKAAPEPTPPDRVAKNLRGNAVEADTKHEVAKEQKKSGRPAPAAGNPADEPVSRSERQALPASPSAALTVPGMKEVAGAASGASARALFYAEGSPGSDPGFSDEEQHARPSQAPERFALRKTLDRTAPAQPLALRYALVIRTPDGADREVTAVEAANHTGPVLLRIETNQQAYVQVWTSAGDSLPELVLPAKETGRISLNTTARQRQEIVVPPERDRVTIRVSRVPFGPITRQEAVMAGRSTGNQLTEQASSKDDQATYVANPAPSASELAVDIAVGARTKR